MRPVRIASFPVQAVTVEYRSSSELSGLDLLFASRSGTATCGICFLLSVLCCTTGIHHFVAELNLRHLDCFFSSSLGLGLVSAPSREEATRLSSSACWNSDAESQELPTSFALSGWAMLGVASQTGTSTIRSMIRFEMTRSCGAKFITAAVFQN